MKVIDFHTHIHLNDGLLTELKESKYINGVNIICIRNVFNEDNLNKKDLLNEVKGKEVYITAGISFEDLKRENVVDYYKEYDFIKIHPRFQKYCVKDIAEIFKNLKKLNIKKSIIIDMFPYGNNGYYIQNYNPLNYESLVNEFEDFKIVFAHFGGIYVREVFMMLKCYKNLYADTSLITRYFKDSQIDRELYYFIKRMNGDRILFGSDYPELHLDENFILQLENFEKFNITNKEMDKIFNKNFYSLLDK